MLFSIYEVKKSGSAENYPEEHANPTDGLPVARPCCLKWLHEQWLLRGCNGADYQQHFAWLVRALCGRTGTLTSDGIADVISRVGGEAWRASGG